MNNNKQLSIVLGPSLRQARITFDDLPSAAENVKAIPNTYRRLKWTGIVYAHELWLKKNHPNSGLATFFMPGGSPHIAYFADEASINVEHPGGTFTLVSLTACAAWNDDLQLTIIGYRNSVHTNTYTATLLFGIPQLILLQWKNIDNVIFKPAGGTLHPGSGGFASTHVVITQLVTCPVQHLPSNLSVQTFGY